MHLSSILASVHSLGDRVRSRFCYCRRRLRRFTALKCFFSSDSLSWTTFTMATPRQREYKTRCVHFLGTKHVTVSRLPCSDCFLEGQATSGHICTCFRPFKRTDLILITIKHMFQEKYDFFVIKHGQWNLMFSSPSNKTFVKNPQCA